MSRDLDSEWRPVSGGRYTIGPQVTFEVDEHGRPKMPWRCRWFGHDLSGDEPIALHLRAQGYHAVACRRCRYLRTVRADVA